MLQISNYCINIVTLANLLSIKVGDLNKMKRVFIYFLFAICYLLSSFSLVMAQDTLSITKDTLTFQGQLTGWVHYNKSNALPVYMGGRYIPQLNYQIKMPDARLIDFEGSANIMGTSGFKPFDTVHNAGDITPYRLWVRYSTKQAELRLGLQKINFGSATLIRPLMWFDQLDPRDPQQLTNGTWGLLGRYYFLNNANLWLWGLYGNKQQRPWDVGTTYKNKPEFGGRFQTPAPKGEAALSYHFREVDMSALGTNVLFAQKIPENRIGFDAKFDLKVGLWVEGSWINKSRNVGMLTNQELLNVGTDYTFGLGNGLNVIYEQLLFASDERAFAFSRKFSFSAFSLNYPLSIDDNINVISFYDWGNKAMYNFVNIKHQFKYFSLFLMVYWNPETYNLPQQGNTGAQYAGKGAQFMIIYNH